MKKKSPIVYLRQGLVTRLTSRKGREYLFQWCVGNGAVFERVCLWLGGYNCVSSGNTQGRPRITPRSAFFGMGFVLDIN